MGLVICKHDVKSKFLSKWKSYVKAILQYAEKSRKKNISNKLIDLDQAGMYKLLEWEGANPCEQLGQFLCLYLTCVFYDMCTIFLIIDENLVALKILAECLGKGEKTLCYLYEEYSVSNCTFCF